MNVQSFSYGLVGANMYVLTFGKRAIVIDPCCPWEETDVSPEITVCAILCTHGHFDHISEADSIVARFSCPLYISREDAAMLPDAELNHASSFGLDISVRTTPHLLSGEKLSPKDLGLTDDEPFSLKVVPTPGHTAGSVCFLFDLGTDAKKIMFTGDMLFYGSVGRTDLGGSEEQMRMSIERLRGMDDDIVCFPGHGSSTYLGKEKLYNPFFVN